MPGPRRDEPTRPTRKTAATAKAATAKAADALARPDVGNPNVEVAELRTELAARLRERDDLASRLEDREARVVELQQAQAAQSEELGRLRAVATSVDGLTSERDSLRQRVVELQERLPAQIEEQVSGRLAEITKAHLAETAALKKERDRLKERVVELEKPSAETGPAMTTAALAGHFAGVLSDLAEQPTTRPDLPYTASVTGFSITAKGLLRATEGGDVELVTPKPGTVSADHLSTLNLDLKLLPRLPGAGQQPPSG